MELKEQEKARKFLRFISFRTNIGLVLSGVVFIIYYAIIGAMGFDPEFLGLKIGDTPVSLGIVLGVFFIALSIVLTGAYTFIANSYFDKELQEALDELKANGLLDKYCERGFE